MNFIILTLPPPLGVGSVNHEISANEIYKSQHVDARIKNFIFGEYKSAQVGYPINNVPPEVSCGVYEHPPIRREYESLLAKQKMGREKFFPQVAAELWKVTG